MVVAGIDPGLSGAVAFLESGGRLVGIADTPTFRMAGNRREYDVGGMVQLLRAHGVAQVFVERQGPRPGASAVSVFKLGYGYGLWLGILAALGVRHTVVSPQVWQQSMYSGAVGARDKDRSILVASRLFPDADIGGRHDRADALLIAEWGRRMLLGRQQ